MVAGVFPSVSFYLWVFFYFVGVLDGTGWVLDRFDVIEKYIVLLLGVVDRPLPSLLHLEKELFILSKVNQVVQRFIRFGKHYKGPCSDVVNELVRNPLHHVDAFKIEDDRIFLTQKGRDLFNKLVEEGKGGVKN